MASRVREIDPTRISPNLRIICENETIDESCPSLKCFGRGLARLERIGSSPRSIRRGDFRGRCPVIAS